MRNYLLLIGLILCNPPVNAVNYTLTPEKIAPDTYAFIGKTEDFSTQNGGNIINTAFIVTDAGVIIIDTGVSLRYGKAQRTAISTITDKPILKILHTNYHPDRFLGNQAYNNVTIAALPATIQGMKEHAEDFTNNMYRMIGSWMQGTEAHFPTETLQAGKLTIGNHVLQLYALQGHTPADLMIFDQTTGVLFTGGIVFYQRMPTTPSVTQLSDWLDELDTVEKIPFKVLFPSHGVATTDKQAIIQTRDYLHWLQKTLTDAAEAGRDMAEVMQIPLPDRFITWGVGHPEFVRSVVHLYPTLEVNSLYLEE
ncbi:Zn-dependent hydrolase, glyoxylase [Beggiatoa alba B18LD]|uniref:Zn-dependent hydrolase, glyoxylase n=1 Tax=Beggiatoa alba B18LD TaxID=395493 RepID=I3CIE7_9GAMM|nr:quinoprotein relay system zinc metallohydrolase 1 [Beggiatoa alba]EIJ43390.1 Zn-dependent hydrolase, glyoxylase [Beggiatoa alba B18LD]